ncbi:hypothetical protein JJE64_04845 [Alloprevotella tannerae]|uniref:DUF6965 family protein n=1 Tax=Alloprevotella tannerae TaxID=76122 RepID=UPI001EDB5579|nr:hypothetical protein [Alloprevotella tannerae]MCG2650731.1 hypothetical protein [Alloprevotella tannerae]
MEYKKLYTEEEIKELAQWFEARYDRLPSSVRIDEATFIPDLRKTAPLLIDMMLYQQEKPAFMGEIHQIFRLRERLIADGMD